MKLLLICLVATLLLISGFLLGYELRKKRRQLREDKRADEISKIYHLMLKKLEKLNPDPTTTVADWRGWLPIFEETDRLFFETHPHINLHPRLASIVKANIIIKTSFKY